MMQWALGTIIVAGLTAGIAVPVGAQGPSVSAPPGAIHGDASWWRVRAVDAGTEILVAVDGESPRACFFAIADENAVSVFHIDDSLPSSPAREVLRRVARRHPDRILAAQLGARFVLEHDVRLGPDGVFVGTRHVADLGQLIEHIPRHSVRSITRRVTGRGFWGRLGPLGGYFVGALGGGYAAGLACRAAGGANRCDTGAFLTGAMVGGVAGGAYGWHAARRETEEVIYRSP
jgi:hypothetical protein